MVKRRGIMAELKQGILNKWRFYLLLFFMVFVFSFLFCMDKSRLITQGKISGQISFADGLIYFFRGMKEYVPSQNKVFDVVDSYLIWNVLLAFMIGSYPIRNLKEIGKQYILRSQTRGHWWMIKCIWNVCTVFLFYVEVWLGIICGMLMGQVVYEHVNTFRFQINEELFLRVFRTELTGAGKEELIVCVLLLPLAAALAISMFQMMTMFLVNNAVGYMAVLIVVISSAYWMKDVFIGNAMMVFRYWCVNSAGIHWQITLVSCMVIWLGSALIGYWKFKNQDIF